MEKENSNIAPINEEENVITYEIEIRHIKDLYITM